MQSASLCASKAVPRRRGNPRTSKKSNRRSEKATKVAGGRGGPELFGRKALRRLRRSAQFDPEGIPRGRGSPAAPKACPRRSEKTAQDAVCCRSPESFRGKALRR